MLGPLAISEVVKRAAKTRDMADYADMFAAMGAEQRLQIMRLLLSAHPQRHGCRAILAELKIAPSTMSHHLEKLKHEGLVERSTGCEVPLVQRQYRRASGFDPFPLFRVLFPLSEGNQVTMC